MRRTTHGPWPYVQARGDGNALVDAPTLLIAVVNPHRCAILQAPVESSQKLIAAWPLAQFQTRTQSFDEWGDVLVGG